MIIIIHPKILNMILNNFDRFRYIIAGFIIIQIMIPNDYFIPLKHIRLVIYVWILITLFLYKKKDYNIYNAR